ncbi:hypothetical protein BX600DRAFT_432111 [Xylariales sp. PMI_506]|nr:hypothetical protein BX600DRAFT_432111 [Xylariales sp. PMI_506]
MKYSAAAVAIISATGTLAAPAAAKRDYSTPDYLGFVFPSVLKTHSINTNVNTFSDQTVTVRNGNAETSTLYQLPIPAEAAGKTCGLLVRAYYAGDDVEGEQALDIFNNNIDDLAALEQGNFRNQQLARVRLDTSSEGFFVFDESPIAPLIQSFPCPVGKTLEWESVAVGTADTVIISQDYSWDGTNFPNGLTIAFW